MIEGTDKTRKYTTWAVGGFLVLGFLLSYVFYFGSIFLPQDRSVFPGNWFVRGAVIYLSISLAILASTGKNRPVSIRFWILSATYLIGMFFLRVQLVEVLILTFPVGYILYESFEEFRGFLARAAKSYGQLRSEVEK